MRLRPSGPSPFGLRRAETEATRKIRVLQLPPPPNAPLRVGITWQVDDAEPKTAIVSRVIPGSPAATAGLQSNDRIHEINGRAFRNDGEMGTLLKTLPGPLRMLVERQGRLRTIEIYLEPKTMQRAA